MKYSNINNLLCRFCQNMPMDLVNNLSIEDKKYGKNPFSSSNFQAATKSVEPPTSAPRLGRHIAHLVNCRCSHLDPLGRWPFARHTAALHPQHRIPERLG